jgi:CDP-diacylglycerol--serine O-phosphatidyltransferase
MGFFSIVYAMRGEWMNSAIAIMIAAFTDGIDGRLARLTKTQSAFGEQYDSMSDLVSFGVAPAILMQQWALSPYGRLGWLACFFFLTCAALRLARFNVLKQHSEKRYFQGCPSPVAACSVASAVLFYLAMDFVASKSVYMLIVMFILAAAMISTIRYRSFKDMKFHSQTHFAYLLAVIAFLVVLAAQPELLLFPIAMVYIVSGPLGELSRLMRRTFKWYPGKGRI